jgi:hypothetical protein
MVMCFLQPLQKAFLVLGTFTYRQAYIISTQPCCCRSGQAPSTALHITFVDGNSSSMKIVRR